MRVFLILDREICPIDEDGIINIGVDAWFKDDLDKSVNQLRKKNFRKPEAIIFDEEIFKEDGSLTFELVQEKLEVIREVCPNTEIIFMYTGMLSRNLKKILATFDVQYIKRRKFDAVAFCMDMKTAIEQRERKDKIDDKIDEKIEDEIDSATDEEINDENDDNVYVDIDESVNNSETHDNGIEIDNEDIVQQEQLNDEAPEFDDIDSADIETVYTYEDVNSVNIRYVKSNDTDVGDDADAQNHEMSSKQTVNVQIKVLQADGYTKFTEPLKMLKGVKLVGIALTREEVFESVKKLQPDVVTLSPDLKGDTDILELVDKISGKARIIFINPSRLPQIDRRMLLEYNVEFLDYLTIGALEVQIKKNSSLELDVRKINYENMLPTSSLNYKKVPNLIVVASAKSAGKTMVAVNLAVKLAEAGNSTILMDLTDDQDVNSWLKVEGNKDGLMKVFRGANNIEKIAWIPHRLNLDNLMVLTGDSSVYRVTYERKGLSEVLKLLTEIADYVVIDLPNGFQNIQTDVTIRSAGRVLLITDTGPARLERTVTAINSLIKRYMGPDKFTVVLNNVADECSEQVSYIKEKTGMDVSFVLPSRPIEVNESIKNGEPICLYNPEFSNKFSEMCEFIEQGI